MTDDNNKEIREADDLARCRAECEEYLNGWKRAKADLANYKREEAERLELFVQFAAEGLMLDFIPVMESFDLGIQAALGNEAAVQGMLHIRSQLESILLRRGLERFTALPGAFFDPARHEAVGEAPGQGPPGTIGAEVGAGFLFQGKVVRPARVLLVDNQKPAPPGQTRDKPTIDNPPREVDN